MDGACASGLREQGSLGLEAPQVLLAQRLPPITRAPVLVAPGRRVARREIAAGRDRAVMPGERLGGPAGRTAALENVRTTTRASRPILRFIGAAPARDQSEYIDRQGSRARESQSRVLVVHHSILPLRIRRRRAHLANRYATAAESTAEIRVTAIFISHLLPVRYRRASGDSPMGYSQPEPSLSASRP